MQVGSGVAVAAVSTQFTQGSFENTGNATDLAIDGEGFFMVKDKEGAQYYTRAGAFHIAETGILEDNNGYQVQGYNNVITDLNGEDKLSSISLKNVLSKPKATTSVSMGINLDETAAAGDKFNVSQTVYDSKGMQHNLSTTYQKTEKAGTWGYTIKLDDTNMSTGQSADGLIFNKNGDISGMYHGEMGAAAISPTIGTGVNPGAGTINRAVDVTSSGTMVLTKSGAGTWTITNNAGYANAQITELPAGTLNVDLVGSGTSFHFNIDTAAGSWNSGDTLSCALTTGPAAAAVTATHRAIGTATQTLLKPGQIYKSTTSPIVITESGDGSGIWTVTNKGGYDNLTISTQESGKIKVDLDGAGGSDLYFDISAASTWMDGDTVSFSLTKTDVPIEDQVLQFSSLGKDPTDPNNPTIGVHDPSTNKNKVTWALVSDTAEHISGYASGSAVNSLNNDGYTSGVLKSISIGSDGIMSGSSPMVRHPTLAASCLPTLSIRVD